MSYQVINPFIQFVDPINGKPLSAGEVYFGRMDSDPKNQPSNRINVYAVQDNGSEVLLSQPIELNGAGQPQYSGSVKQIKVEIYAGESAYSLQLFDRKGAQKGYTPRASSQFDAFEADSIADLVSAFRIDGKQYNVSAYLPNWQSYYKEPDGGGVFVWDSAKSKTLHDGGLIIDPERPFPSNWGSESQKATWFTASSSGIGCFVRANIVDIDPVLFGAPEIDINANSTKQVQQAINACKLRDWRRMRCKYLYAIFAPLIVDRPIGAGEPNSYWNVVADEVGGLLCRFAGALFSTSIAQSGDDPVAQLIRFKGVQLSGDGNGTDRFILDGNKFLRISFDQCTMTFIRCLNTISTKYVQSIYFNGGNIRKNTGTFFNADVGYDVKVAGGTLLEAHSGDAFRIKTPIGCSLIGSNLEGISGTAFDYERAQGLAFVGMYWEANGRDIDGSNMDDSASYGVANVGGYHSVSTLGYNVKWGPTLGGASLGNWATGQMHEFTDAQTATLTPVQDAAQIDLSNELVQNTAGVYVGTTPSLVIRANSSATYTTSVTHSAYTVRDDYFDLEFVATVTSTATNSAGKFYIESGIPFDAIVTNVLCGTVAVIGQDSGSARILSTTPARIESLDNIIPAMTSGQTITVSGLIKFKIAP